MQGRKEVMLERRLVENAPGKKSRGGEDLGGLGLIGFGIQGQRAEERGLESLKEKAQPKGESQ